MTSVPAATALRDRALGPDLARGVMLLFIALANSHYFLTGLDHLGGFPRDGGTIDRIVTWLIATCVDGRAFPMFGLLFGYGVAQVVRRQQPRGRGGTRTVLWRRAGALVVIGFSHAILLYIGDIIAAYGVLLAAGAFVVHWRDRWLLILAAFFFLLTALPDDGTLADTTVGPGPAELPPDLWTAIVERLQAQPFIMLLGPIGFACPFLLGLWAGRRRILERPGQYRRLLTAIMAVGIPVGLLGAQPFALVLADTSEHPGADSFAWMIALHTATGMFAGAGYAAALTLLALRLAPSPGPVVQALAATGQRSMTCYLCQSVVWSLAFTPYLLDLSGRLSVTTTAVLAIATWIATVALATTLGRLGRRGPFEVLLRSVTYGRPPVPTETAATVEADT